MVRRVFVAIVVMLLGAGLVEAQYARPVEVTPVRPVAPAPNVITPSPGLVAPALPAPAPTITNPPTAVVPTPPPEALQRDPDGAHEAEFSAWSWEPIQNVPNLVVPFKHQVYERVVAEFAKFAR